MPGTQHITINLAKKPKEKIESVFLSWVIQIGRIIIIATEIVALGALLYRFIIDRQIVDLHDQIRREELFVKNQENKEKEYRGIQGRLASIKAISSETKTKINVMNDILNALKAGNFLSTNLLINQNVLTINGTSFSVFSINNFIEAVKKQPSVSAISIDEITAGEQGIKFKLNIELKQTSPI